MFLWSHTTQQFSSVEDTVIPSSDLMQTALSGFSVFTTLPWPTTPQLFSLHLTRLQNNAEVFNLAFDFPTVNQLTTAVNCVLNTEEAVVIRLTIVPQQIAAVFTDTTPKAIAAQLLLTTRPLPKQPDTLNPSAGLSLQSVVYQKAFPQIKHGGLTEGWLLKKQAQQNGFDDALWINQQGMVTECTTANIFFITKNQQVWTPAVEEAGCLPGITRHQTIECLKANGVIVHQKAFTLEEVLAVTDGCFTTNSVQGARLVFKINSYVLPWFQKALALFKLLLV